MMILCADYVCVNMYGMHDCMRVHDTCVGGSPCI